jgi:hypothetical protein
MNIPPGLSPVEEMKAALVLALEEAGLVPEVIKANGEENARSCGISGRQHLETAPSRQGRQRRPAYQADHRLPRSEGRQQGLAL